MIDMLFFRISFGGDVAPPCPMAKQRGALALFIY
jgi:hypothetical protein